MGGVEGHPAVELAFAVRFSPSDAHSGKRQQLVTSSAATFDWALLDEDGTAGRAKHEHRAARRPVSQALTGRESGSGRPFALGDYL